MDTQKNKITKKDLNEIYIKGQEYKDVWSKRDIWRELAKHYRGEFIINQTVSKDVNTLIMEIPYKDHMLMLRESDTRPLKFEIDFKLNRDFEFSLSWEDMVERFLKFFRKKEIVLGHKAFDHKYVIVSNDADLLLELLNYRDLYRQILMHNLYLFNLTARREQERHTLMTVKDRNTSEMSVLIDLIEMHCAIIDFFIEKRILRS